MRGITEKQGKILEFIKLYIRKRRISPSIREIANYFEISPHAAYLHKFALEKKGFIKSQSRKPRTIQVLA